MNIQLQRLLTGLVLAHAGGIYCALYPFAGRSRLTSHTTRVMQGSQAAPNAYVSRCSPGESAHPLPPAWLSFCPQHVTEMYPSQQGFEQAEPFYERNEAQQTSQQQQPLSRRNPSPVSRALVWCIRLLYEDFPLRPWLSRSDLEGKRSEAE